MTLPEFIRGNQRSYLRVICDRQLLEQGYEYHMYTRNEMRFLLPGTFRNIEGENYLYFDISSRQSLDVLLRIKKLNRQLALRLFSDIHKLCAEMDKYLLNLQKVSFQPRYIMYSQEKNDFRFLYQFAEPGDQWQQELIQLAELLVERLDYGDDELVETVYHFYERLIDDQETINLRELTKMVLDAVSDQEASEEAASAKVDLRGAAPEQVMFSGTGTAPDPVILSGRRIVPDSSPVRSKYKKGLLIELILLLAIDVCAAVWTAPGRIAVLFFQIVTAIVCSVLIGWQLWQRKKELALKEAEEKKRQEAVEEEYREEFQSILQTQDPAGTGTQIISIEQVFPKLYSVFGREPEYIEIVGQQLVGSQEDMVQVWLKAPGVSRIHASLRRDSQGNSVLEDLNSTNGTWVNESRLAPRVPYILNRGDKVSFAGCDYIFR